ncbi:hypothetical protein [uncultured Fibrobacter sp.]|uniref:hypothetical protein n=1 Tax=uncultured Fibrobacter sp. TaxID=261512 RepID=UPI0025D9E62B|nr:hypothetical protein [uncultured Fibrobacter sp.]
MEIITLCISLLSFFAALAAVIVPIVIFKKQRKYDEEAEKRCVEREKAAEQRQVERDNLAKQEQERKERKRFQDRKDARREANASSLARLAGVTEELEEDIYLDKQLGKR